jgi:hypothetical protein
MVRNKSTGGEKGVDILFRIVLCLKQLENKFVPFSYMFQNCMAPYSTYHPDICANMAHYNRKLTCHVNGTLATSYMRAEI